jgi:hypothetical protein
MFTLFHDGMNYILIDDHIFCILFFVFSINVMSNFLIMDTRKSIDFRMICSRVQLVIHGTIDQNNNTKTINIIGQI